MSETKKAAIRVKPFRFVISVWFANAVDISLAHLFTRVYTHLYEGILAIELPLWEMDNMIIERMISMKPIKRSLFIRLGVFIVTAIVIAMVANQVMAFNQPIPGNKLPSTPMLQQSDLKTSNGEIVSQPGQRTISIITDLALGISEENKMVYVVQRIDGKYEQFFLPAEYSGDIRKLMGLKEGEKIITGFALI